MDLFDSPWKIAIIAILIIVLFGSRKLPGAARALGQSMRILKTEVQGLHEDDPAAPATAAVYVPPAQVEAPAQIQTQAAVPATDAQAQIDALSKQLDHLKQSVAANNGTDGAQAK